MITNSNLHHAGIDTLRLLERLPIGCLVTDIHLNIMYANPTYHQMVGDHPSSSEFEGQIWDSIQAHLPETIPHQTCFRFEFLVKTQNNRSTIMFEATVITDDSGNGHPLVYIYLQDKTHHYETETALRKSETRYRSLVENQGEGVTILNDHLFFEYINSAGGAILGLLPENIVGLNLRQFLNPEQQQLVLTQLENRRKGLISSYELMILRADKRERCLLVTSNPRFDANGKFTGVFAIFRDITQRKIEENQLIYLSSHDQLTGLFNRTYFESQLQIFQTKQLFPIGIIIVDIDGLKTINDSRGHLAGDKAIIRVAEILNENISSSNLLARIGGDEFAIILPEINQSGIEDCIAHLNLALDQYNTNCRQEEIISFSVGGAITYSSESLEEAIALADDNMYRHKRRRR